jgi:hypothetical protein
MKYYILHSISDTMPEHVHDSDTVLAAAQQISITHMI